MENAERYTCVFGGWEDIRQSLYPHNHYEYQKILWQTEEAGLILDQKLNMVLCK